MGKNWKEIAKIEDRYLRIALARADWTDTEGSRLRIGFPECFETEGDADEGPVPWSVLKDAGEQASADARGNAPPYALMHFDILAKYDIPAETYSLTPENQAAYGFPMLPDEAKARPHDFGDIVEMDGARFVVVDLMRSDEVTLAPIERINMDA